MSSRLSSSKAVDVRPQEIVRDLLSRTVVPSPQHVVTPARERRIATLERQAPTIVHQARQADVDITYLGINPLFAETRLYRGVETNWTLAPAKNPDDAIVPRDERQSLERLAKADIHFPLIYVAHEVDKTKTEGRLPADRTYVRLEPDEVGDIVPEVPEPAGPVEYANELDRRATQVLGAMRRVALFSGKAALAVAAAPVVLVGGALATVATLDPIILGAIPAVTAEAGEPAAWYVLARWEW